ncbi:phage tail sheath subtilisin-like domain-containing protein [Bradyrhizobium sp. 26S5]|uniref:phage tail sheath subtilisin-like domain-containing protein n=1 Tax=Bradyrhizobium sp. 26S5 TaxID=3139729 RepID=UPI0030D3E47F
MPSYRAPGVYVEEISSGSRPIAAAGTSTAAFVGVATKGPVGTATLVPNLTEFEKIFGGPYPIHRGHYLYYAVRHFFEQGGTRCYVVRVAHFDDAATAAASCAFGGKLPDATAVPDALKVSAISPGDWGQELAVQVTPSSKFSVRLADDIVAGSTTQIRLELNDQVQPGTLLWFAGDPVIIGRVDAVKDPNAGTITLGKLRTTDKLFDGELKTDMSVFAPDFSYEGLTKLDSPIAFTAGVPHDPQNSAIKLSSLKKADGGPLQPGDTLGFAANAARIVVDRVSVEQVTVEGSSKPVTLVEFTAQTLPAFTRGTRVYARDFTISVRKGDQVVEVHENLSLVNSNHTDHVDIRLGPDSAGSLFIIARDGSDNKDLTLVDPGSASLQGGSDGLDALKDADFIAGVQALTPVRDASILAVPNASVPVLTDALGYCERRGDLFLILEKPNTEPDLEAFRNPLNSKYGALYHPWIEVADVMTGRPVLVPPSGAVAGIYALTDSRRGVHKAPAGLDTGKVVVATGVERALTKAEYDSLYPQKINGILKQRDGIFVWGSRTLSADDEWLQVNVRRLFIFLEKSIENGTQWVTFEPNDLTLRKSIERNVSAFLRIQWLEGKLVGKSEKEAFFVQCDAETNPPEVVSAGQVVTVIGVAPSRPAEFVIFRLKQTIDRTS